MLHTDENVVKYNCKEEATSSQQAIYKPKIILIKI